jgi:hypothetical protein
VRILGRDFKVIRDTNATEALTAWGFCDRLTDEIVLRKRGSEYTEGQEKSTFLHESIHVIDDLLKLGLNEEQVSLLSVGVLALIVDNKLDFLSCE